jgi:phosphoglycolate phosphatase-like HAD superfamily hydrolase
MKCYLFDIDGTLANCHHRLYHIEQAPKDWRNFFAACLRDEPISHIIELLSDLHEAGACIVLVSGRSNECRTQTVEWLHIHTPLKAPPLYMRKAGDHRPDDIIKLELLAQLRVDGFDPMMAFDDRDRVVKAWRSAGIPCAQVAEGDF